MMSSIGNYKERTSNDNTNMFVMSHHPPSCFSASQWQELELQALVFKYMVSGVPIPPDLLRTSCIGSWNRFEMGKKIDTEPGRCRRTDGKKWRCSKEAFPDSKYCERHMHRGRNRSKITAKTNNPIKNTPPHFLSKYSTPFPSQQDTNFHFSSTNHNPINSSPSKLTMGLMGNSFSLSHVNKHSVSISSTPPSSHKRVMHRFLDESSPKGEHEHGSSSSPKYLHDFFITQKWKQTESTDIVVGQ